MFLLPFHVVGCSHETSAADLVGRVRLSPKRMEQLLLQLHAREVEAVLVSTCHRTELYWWGDADLAAWFADEVVGTTSDITPTGNALAIERREADLAVRHLFAVAAGMQSARYGEPEIMGQVREAWRLARSTATSRGPLDGVFRRAIDAARHIRAAMGSDADPALGARVRARLADFLDGSAGARDAQPSLLIVGSGDAARGVLDALQQHPLPGLTVRLTNRTDARAQAVAAAYGVDTVSWERRQQAIAQSDMVVYAIQATVPLVSRVDMPAMSSAATPRLWIDLGVPGAVADDVYATSATHGSVQLVPLDALHERSAPAVAASRARRAGSALQRELDRFARTTHRMQLGARLGDLEARAMAVAAQHRDVPADELARRVTRLVLRELTRA